jgi:rubredoxin
MSERPYRKYQCSTCGEVYDEALGNPIDGLAPGTRFEDIPESWICPNCGADKSSYILRQE